jgi:predicted enzyme related to lactoylglutathione lyase
MDLLTSDTAQAREFYGPLFGWTGLEASQEFGGYFMFTLDGAPVAGCMPVMPGMDIADVWGTYLVTHNMGGAIETAVAHGATVRVPAMPVADLGTQAVLDDVTGARIGLWQPESFSGFGPIGTGRHGSPAYFELHTLDYPRAVAFYRDALGLDLQVLSDTAEMRIAGVLSGGQPITGILDSSAYMAPGEREGWDVYVSVDDTDKVLAAAIELGGTVAQEAIDTPFGRLGVAVDPMGARVWVVSRGNGG